MATRTRTLAGLAAAALFTPLVSLGSPALAAGEATPPSPRSVEAFCAEVPATYDPFVDDSGNTFERNIECLAAAAITRGGPDGLPQNRYGPERVVRRDAMAAFIARLIDKADQLEEGDSIRALPEFDGTVDFTDVPADNPHREPIDRLAEAGIVSGGPEGRPRTQYGPELPVSRAQMASFIINALEYMTGDEFETTQDFFTDDEDAQPHTEEINAVAIEAIAVGDGRDSYAPFRAVSRGQMAGFLTRTLALLLADGDITPLVFGAEFDDLAVTPDDEQTLPARTNPDGATADNRGYTVNGLVNGVVYRISLVRAENANLADGTFRAAADGLSSTGFSADTGAPTADITIVNGSVTADNDADTAGFQNGSTTFTAGGTSATFTIDGDAPNENVLPVVHRNGAAGRTGAEGGTSPRLELAGGPAGDFTGPIEAYDAGGVTRLVSPPPMTVTARPELVDTAIVRTFTDAGPTAATQDDRQLTEVRFTFDEEVTGKTPAANLFHLVGFDSAVRFDGTSATVEQAGDSVLVTFGRAVTASSPGGQNVGEQQLRDMSVATVDVDAVRDVGNIENAIGSDVFGTSRTETRGRAGVTGAPDLQTVDSFASPAGQGTTQATFTFDATAFTVNRSAFHLVTVGNQDIGCTAVAGVNGGDPAAGEQADTTIVVDCPETVLGRDIVAADIGRGYVAAGGVSDRDQDTVPGADGTLNPLQATQTPDADTTGPDLASATFAAADDRSDQATYTFDEPVLVLDDTDTDGGGADTDTDGTTGQGDFRVYTAGGGAGTVATSVSRSATNSRQVIATFPDGALADTVGASVQESAVQGATGAAGRANQEDEVGVDNLQATELVAGFTDGPDLTGVAVNGDGSAAYTFDSGVATDTASAAGNVVEARLFLVLAEGTGLQCTAATVVADADTVRCTSFTVLVPGGGAATAAQVQSAVLGTVDEAAVRDATGDVGPEADVITTGSSGTARS